MNKVDERGFHESQFEARNPELDCVGILRGTPEQAVAIEKTFNADGSQTANTRIRGLNEGDIDRFDQNWSQQTQTPFWNEQNQARRDSITAPRSSEALPASSGSGASQIRGTERGSSSEQRPL